MIPGVNPYASAMQKPEMTSANGPGPQGGVKKPIGPSLSIQREAVFSLLKQLAIDNEVYFRQYGPTVFTTRVADICEEIANSADIIKNLVKRLQEIAPNYDYDSGTPGNGFRSLICVSDLVLLRLVSVLRTCSESRGQMMFRVTHYCKEIESLGAVVRFLILAFHQVVSMLSMLDRGSLFPPLESEYQQYNKILKGIESLDASCFYGRLFGSQFCPSVTRIFRVIGIVLATYSLSWQSGTAAFGSLIHSGKLLLNPEQRAAHIIKVTREADIEFCRGFWNLSEIPVPNLFCPSMAVCEARDIPPSGPMPLKTRDGSTILIHEPAAHTGARPVRMKVLSLHHRTGLSPENVSNRLPLSSQLVIHCHGGGYVATSSRSHETYLRSWAKSLKCTLVSIDYSLAPENPFPRPTEEVIYAYAWILNNPDKVGWTGEKVCMVGDSAGGNLIVSVNLKLVELNVERMPDGLVPIYTPFLFQYLPSPSRVLSFMDPLLHMGVVIRCAAAYTGSYSDEELDKDCAYHESASTPRAHKSLQEYVDQVQRAQREKLFDFSQGSQSIVSLINLSQTKAPYPPRQQQQQKAVQSSTPREQSLGASVESSRQTTAGETEDVTMKSEGGEDAEEHEENAGDEDESNNTVQTVNVDGDPLHICLSATNADSDLIDYLQMHPLTKSSVLPPVSDATTAVDASVAAHEEHHDCAFIHSTPIQSMMEGPFKIGSASGAPLPSPIPMQELGSGGVEMDRLTSSGSAPSQASKTKLTKSKGRSLSQSLAEVAAGVAGHAYDNVSDWFDAPKTPVGQGDKQKLTRATTLSTLQAARVQQEEAENMESHFTELLKLKLPRDPFMSPLYAPDSLLRKLPPIRFVACHLDPLLDDTIMFAKRMRNAGGTVVSVDLLDSLPHGFLNFAPMSSDCREGANVCLKRIRETLR